MTWWHVLGVPFGALAVAWVIAEIMRARRRRAYLQRIAAGNREVRRQMERFLADTTEGTWR